MRVDDEVLIAGVVVRDAPMVTTAWKKRRKTESASVIGLKELERAIESARSVDALALREFDAVKKRVIDQYLSSDEYRVDALKELRDLVEQALFQTHDFVGLLKQIRSNVLTIFELRYPGEPPEVAADRPDLENEGAIYFAAELMINKIDTHRFLREPNLALGKLDRFTLHRFVSKYAKVYRSFARQRDIDMFISGESYGLVRYNSEALGVVIHALLDNAVKYAPVGSKVDLVFEEGPNEILVRLISLGPRIEPSETKRIFTVGYQAKAAAAMEAAGIGFGLAAAKTISDLLDLGLKVRQESSSDQGYPAYHQTEFSLSFDKVGTED